ncbi:MAG: hypothetical protein HKM07_02335 [Chlamydiae bacterium]|nr:hypothetical protein [Chlamydiota bacterium]
MDLKNYDAGKFIDRTASQLLHYLFPKKGQIEGSLASKPWMKKIRLLCWGAITWTLLLLVYLIMDSALAPLQFLLGIIFLAMVLGCFLVMGVSALFKRDGSIFYLYLLKGCIWIFCGSLLFAGIGWLMSSRDKPINTKEEKVRIEERQRKTQEREARQKSDDEQWEASGVSSPNPIGKLQKEIQLVEEYQKIIAEKDKKIQALEKALEERQ